MEDLKHRTFHFAIRVIRLAEALPNTKTGGTIANQIIRCGSSVGANYRAARRARSTKEFIAKLGIVEEECDETIYWLELAVATQSIRASLVEDLTKEAGELLAITVASIKSTKAKLKTKAN